MVRRYVAAGTAVDIEGWVQDGFPLLSGLRAVVTGANRQPAVAVYQQRDAGGASLPLTVDVLRISGGAVYEVVTFHADRFPSLGLPASLPADTSAQVA